MATSKTQIVVLKKKLKETEKARELVEKASDQAEQNRFDIGVAETKEALRDEVPGVCMTYYS